jgi:glycosyltransferase involved in cell wall biosynthesis
VPKTIVLIDEPIKFDNRVKESLKNYPEYILEDCAESKGFILSHILCNITLSLKAMLLSPFYWEKLKKQYNVYPAGFLSGLRSSIKIRTLAKRKAYRLYKKYAGDSISVIYAHDLRCGIIGEYLAWKLEAKLIYDTHELSFHRNRKNGNIRVVFDILTENKVIKRASTIKVVNKPIKEVYTYIYKIKPETVEVVNNAFYKPYIGYALDNFVTNQALSIVYVGAGYKGRMLKDLTAYKGDADLHGYFLGDTPNFINNSKWNLGSKDYLPALLDLVNERKLCMWACAEDKCLSYRLSLGNKFFQSIAIGIPIIASEGSYLADIIKEYKLGYIYDGSNLEGIVHSLNDDFEYKTLLQSIKDFQLKFFGNTIIL